MVSYTVFRETGMGNLLGNDSSTVCDIAGEIRTDGDGMEMEKTMELGSLTEGEIVNKTSGRQNLISVQLKNVARPSYPGKNRISPRTLPPAKDLILLKPIRIGVGVTQMQSFSLQNPQEVFLNCELSNYTAKKPRVPKFVPYEPYTGAVRNMAKSALIPFDDPRHSSTQCDTIAVSDSVYSKSGPKPQKSTEFHRQPEPSNTTLLRERLRISEKDIQELQTENARLKRLLVDSLSGWVDQPDEHVSKGSKHYDTVERLSNEVQVWRSKFLSSCVLVEQLTKKKEELVRVTEEAAELFKEIKNHVDLTPDLYNALREWMSSEEKKRILRKESSVVSLLFD